MCPIFVGACRIFSCIMWDLFFFFFQLPYVGSSFLTMDLTWVSWIWSMESELLGHQGSLCKSWFYNLNQDLPGSKPLPLTTTKLKKDVFESFFSVILWSILLREWHFVIPYRGEFFIIYNALFHISWKHYGQQHSNVLNSEQRPIISHWTSFIKIKCASTSSY